MKGYKLVLVVVAMLFVLPTISQAKNLVENGGFEFDLYGWNLINDLDNQVASVPNSSSYTAIEGGKSLHVVVTNADATNAWKSSIKYPIAVVMSPGEKWIMKFSVKKLSDSGVISAGLMDNRSPWQSFFWSGDIDLSKQAKGSVVDYYYEFNLPWDVWYPAAVLNLGGAVQDIWIDKIQVVRKDLYVAPVTTKLSGKIVNNTRYTYASLYVVAYPEGDADWDDVNAVIVPVNKTTKEWSMEVPAGKKYSIELFTKTTTITKRITKPWVWTVNANSEEISGIDFRITGNTYKTSIGWTSIQDPAYQ